jgi:hypothetical protein
VGKR